MLGSSSIVAVVLIAVVLAGPIPPARAGSLRSPADGDVYEIYQRLQPGMTIADFTAAAGVARPRVAPEAVTSWLIWSPPGPGHSTAVLRTTFRDGRLARAEYEVFGDEYRHLVKGTEPEFETTRRELERLWRDRSQLEQAADDCQRALEAYHYLVLGAQNRLTREEQAEWVRALELRRGVELRLRPAGSR